MARKRALAEEERLESIRAYLRLAFPDWQLTDDWNPRRDAHVFRLVRHPEPIHLLMVGRRVLEGNAPAQMVRLLSARGIARALREAPAHRVLLATPHSPFD